MTSVAEALSLPGDAMNASAEILAVHEALERLREWAPRQSQIVEMRYFGGMAEEEIAEYLGISYRTVKREWAMAKAWLHAELSA